MNECTVEAPCQRHDCVHCVTDQYLKEWDSGSQLLDRPRPAARTEPEDVTDARAARLAALTYRRSELDLIAPPGWLVDGFIQRASLTLLSGKFGTYKSFVSIALAASVATGVPFLGMPVVEAGPVIYVAAEGASGLRARLQAWEAAHHGGRPVPDETFIVVGGPVRLLNTSDIAGMENLCKQVGPKLVVWDTLHRCAPGIDEDTSRESGTAIDILAGLREGFGCAQFVNHHTGHGGVRARGSSAWEDDMDGSWVIKLAGDGEDRSATNQRTMEHRKIKDGELGEKINIGLRTSEDSAYIDRMEVEPADLRSWLVAKAYAHQLDAAGVPLSYGRVKVANALHALGVPAVGHDMATEVARMRKAPGYIPASASWDATGTS